MLITTIIARAKRRYTRESLTSMQWEDLIARGVMEYSGWNPVLTQTTITCTGAQDYDLPADCLGVRAVHYEARQTVMSSEGTYAEGLVKREPSLGLIEDINDAEWRDQLDPRWEYLPGLKQLRLSPIPTSGTVYVEYYAEHALNDAADGYDTIPDEDLDILVDLMLYEVYGDRGLELALEPNYTAGMEREDFSHIQASIAQARDALLVRVRGKYGGTGAVWA